MLYDDKVIDELHSEAITREELKNILLLPIEAETNCNSDRYYRLSTAIRLLEIDLDVRKQYYPEDEEFVRTIFQIQKSVNVLSYLRNEKENLKLDFVLSQATSGPPTAK